MPGVVDVKEIVRQAIRNALLDGDDPVAIATGDAIRTPGKRVAFVKTKLEGREVTSLSGQLPDRMEDLVEAISEGLARVILSLQVKGTTSDNPAIGLPVLIPVTSTPGSPSTGYLFPVTPTTKGTPNVTLSTLVEDEPLS
jgi:predicted RecB family endonuclease